eukprot:9410641-Alexandrium_andersonii.AAC.1
MRRSASSSVSKAAACARQHLRPICITHLCSTVAMLWQLDELGAASGHRAPRGAACTGARAQSAQARSTR